MKNKKIILGLGTISALGAMSMAFVACGSKDQLKDYVKKVELLKVIEEQQFLADLDETLIGSKTDPNDATKKIADDLTDLTTTEDANKFEKTGATVNDLIQKIHTKIPSFEDKFEFVLADKEGATKLDGKTSYKLTIKRKNADISKKPYLKTTKEFKFTLKS